MTQAPTIPVWKVWVDSGSSRERERQVIEIAGENARARAEARFREHVRAAQVVVGDAQVSVSLINPNQTIKGLGFLRSPEADQLMLVSPIAIHVKAFSHNAGERSLSDVEIFEGPDGVARAQERWRFLVDHVDDFVDVANPATWAVLVSVVMEVQGKECWTFKKGYDPVTPPHPPEVHP